MSSIFRYEALILLSKKMVVSLENAEKNIRQRLVEEIDNQRVQITRRSIHGTDTLVLTKDFWSLYVVANTDSYVLEESREIAEQFATGRPDQEELRLYEARFELFSDPDPDMDYFNDYVLLVQALSDFTGAVPFEPISMHFI